MKNILWRCLTAECASVRTRSTTPASGNAAIAACRGTICRVIFLMCLMLLAGCGGCSRESGLPLGIVGATEPVFIENFPEPFPAKMDTGADVSSLDAGDITLLTENNRKYVSFSVRNRVSGELRKYKLPLKRTVRIERHGMAPQHRYTVMLNLRIGHLDMKREFTLADRKNFSSQVLIGRNVLKGHAAVDVSVENTLGKKL